MATHEVEVVCIDGLGMAWFKVNGSRVGQGWFNAKNGLRALAVGIAFAVSDWEFREWEWRRACASLRHGIDLAKQPWPVRKLRALLRKLGGEFVYTED